MDRVMRALLVVWLVVLLTFDSVRPARGSISCYTCSSRNGSDASCEDPFHPAMSSYNVSCMVPKGGHIGKFPANFCLKVSGISYDTGERLVIRTCTLENMENQCGEFRFNSEKMAGCVLTCNTDGCNSAVALEVPRRGSTVALWLLAAALVHRCLSRYCIQ